MALSWTGAKQLYEPMTIYFIDVYRVDSRFAPSQWETALLCNNVAYWLGANLESSWVYIFSYITQPLWDNSWWPQYICVHKPNHHCLMTSSNGYFPHYYWSFVRGTTGHRCIPIMKAVVRNFDVFFDLRLNKRLSKQSTRQWFERPSRSLWRHGNAEPWKRYSTVTLFTSLEICEALVLHSPRNGPWIRSCCLIHFDFRKQFTQQCTALFSQALNERRFSIFEFISSYKWNTTSFKWRNVRAHVQFS